MGKTEGTVDGASPTGTDVSFQGPLETNNQIGHRILTQFNFPLKHMHFHP